MYTAHPPDLAPEATRKHILHRPRLHLLVVSHPCITAINQDFFAHVESETGWKVTIVLPKRWTSEYGKHLKPVRWPRFQGHLLPLPVQLAGNIPLHFYSARLSRIFGREHPDAIYVHNEPYAVATYQVLRASSGSIGAPVGFYSAQNILKRYPWPVSAWERYVYRHASFAYPVSQAVADVLKAKGYSGRSEVVPLSVDTDHFCPDGRKDQVAGVRDPMTVGFVGRIVPGKGVETLLQALSCMPSERIRAVIVGDGPAARTLKLRASKMGLDDWLTWTGYVAHEQMPHLYRTMDVLVVPSCTLPRWREQFGRVVIEALACGVPVLTSDSGELPRLVSATGGGWTFPEGDVSALVTLLMQLTSRPAMLAGPGRAGRRAVVKDFGVGTAVARFAGVVEAAVRSTARD
jgi:glycosyltransferase involved in cell wall biosynthesis